MLCASRCWMSCPSCCSSTGSSMRYVFCGWWRSPGVVRGEGEAHPRDTAWPLLSTLSLLGPTWHLGSDTLLCGRLFQQALCLTPLFICLSVVLPSIHPSSHSFYGDPYQFPQGAPAWLSCRIQKSSIVLHVFFFVFCNHMHPPDTSLTSSQPPGQCQALPVSLPLLSSLQSILH